MTLATIAIPTFNRGSDLRRAVESALAQDYEALEVLICDNHSNDETERLCNELAVIDSRIRYVRHAENIGALANFEYALEHAAGQYFMWLADDDWLDPDYLSQCIEALEKGVHLAAGRARWFGGKHDEADEVPVRLHDDDPARRVRRFYRSVVHNSVFYGVYRTSWVRGLPALPQTTGADWLFVAWTAFAGNVDTVQDTRIHRAAGGSSDRITDRRSIPAIVMADIWRSSIFDCLAPVARGRLAIRCGAILCWRIWVREPLLTGIRARIGEAPYTKLRSAYRRVGRARSRADMISEGAEGQAIASDSSSQRTPADAPGT